LQAVSWICFKARRHYQPYQIPEVPNYDYYVPTCPLEPNPLCFSVIADAIIPTTNAPTESPPPSIPSTAPTESSNNIQDSGTTNHHETSEILILAQDSSFPIYAIAIVVVLALLILVCIILVIVYFCCRKRQANTEIETASEMSNDVPMSKLEHSSNYAALSAAPDPPIQSAKREGGGNVITAADLELRKEIGPSNFGTHFTQFLQALENLELCSWATTKAKK
jgi:hypothetical protein